MLCIIRLRFYEDTLNRWEMQMRTLAVAALISFLLCGTCVCQTTSGGKTPSDTQPKHTKKWSKAPINFNCTPQAGVMMSWSGQPGKPDHQDTGTINPNNYMGCVAMSAPNTTPAPACLVIFEHDTPDTIPDRHAILGPNHGDSITLSCNGTAPTCCAIQIWKAMKSPGKSDQ